jgi:hypothetical protein
MNRKDILKSKIKGKIVKTDWGYDMTINEFALILDEKPTTLKAVMIGKKVVGDNTPAGGRAFPDTTKQISKPFTMKKHRDFEKSMAQINRDTLRFVGRASPPHLKGSPQSWWLLEDEDLIKGEYENTWD